MSEEEIRNIVRQEIEFFQKNKKLTLPYPTQILDGNDITIGRTNGTRIGTAASQKLAFFGKTPRVQFPTGTLQYPTGGSPVDAQARARINDIQDILVQFGFAYDIT